jgi:prepilin-type N-terminal cleavage/methylation domain-containing protein
LVYQRIQQLGQRGYSLDEIMVAVAIIGVLVAASVPSVISRATPRTSDGIHGAAVNHTSDQ